MSRKIIIPSLFCSLLIFAGSCDRQSSKPGYSYYNDMEESRAYETYSENPNYPDNKTMQEPVEGTIPRGITPYPYTRKDEDLEIAGKTVFNPLEYNDENLERGKLMYERFCMVCHGTMGDGKGHLYTSGKYTFPPADLTAEKTVSRPDGEIYHIITHGINIMGAYGPLITPEDRWKILMYVREELQKE